MGKKGEIQRNLYGKKRRACLHRRGFKNVTMKDICSVTGLSRGVCTGITAVRDRFFPKLWTRL